MQLGNAAEVIFENAVINISFGFTAKSAQSVVFDKIIIAGFFLGLFFLQFRYF
jgi:hypothetical protein